MMLWSWLAARDREGGGGGGGGEGPAWRQGAQHSKVERGLHIANRGSHNCGSPEQIIISVRSYHLFNINEIFNEVPNCRLISPSLISTGES